MTAPDDAAAWPPDDWTDTQPHFPPALVAYDQWLNQREKQPYSPRAQAEALTDNPYSWSDPDNWMTFADACEWASHLTSIENAYAFISQRPDAPYTDEADPFLMVDGDNVRDPETGAVHPAFLALLADLGPTYCDISRSGTGVHAYYVGELPASQTTGVEWNLVAPAEVADSTACPSVEIYHGKRQYILTGRHVAGTPRDAEPVDRVALCHAAALAGGEPATCRDHEAPARSIDADAAVAVEKNTTDDFDEVLAAVKALSVHDMAMMSECVNRRADGSEDWDPAIPGEPASESGTRLAVLDGGRRVVYRKGNIGADALTLVAWENGTIAPGERLTGRDFFKTIRQARQRGAAIPEYTGTTREHTPDADSGADRVGPSGWSPDEVEADGGPPAESAQASAESAPAPPDPDPDPDGDGDGGGGDPDGGGGPPEAPDDPADLDWGHVVGYYADPDTQTRAARELAIQLLTTRYDWATLEDTEELLRYDPETGIYVGDGERFLGALVERELGQYNTSEELAQITHRIKHGHWTPRDAFGGSADHPVVCVENGVVDIATGAFDDHSPDRLFIRRVPVAYDPDADCPEFDAFLDDVVVKDAAKQLVYELLGHAIHPGYPVAGFAMFYGDGQNGKSTLLEWMQMFLGKDENVANRSVHELADDKFATADLYGKLANIGADLPADRLESTGTLKKLTGGDYITAQKKFQDTFTFRNEATLIFAANEPPETPDETTAFWRRLLLLNFPNEFTPPGSPGPDMVPRRDLFASIASPAEQSGALNRALEAARRLRQTGEFTQVIDLAERADQYKKLTDPVYAFAAECVREADGEYVPLRDLYDIYRAWCEAEDAPKKDKSIFARALATHVRYDRARKSLGGTQETCYTGIELTDRGAGILKALAGSDEPGSDGQMRF